MENSNNQNNSSPWHSPAGNTNNIRKMDRRRLRTPPLKSRHHHQQHLRSPPPNATAAASDSEQPFLWRTRSLDDDGGNNGGGSGRKSRCSPHHHNHHNSADTALQDNHNSNSQEQPLHSSFDASLLDNSDDDFHSIFRRNNGNAEHNNNKSKSKSKRRASGGTQPPQTLHPPDTPTLWQQQQQQHYPYRHHSSSNSSHYSDTAVSTPHSSGRKHLRQPKHDKEDGYNGYENTYHASSNSHPSHSHGHYEKEHDDDDDFMGCPGTVRKLARHNSGESATPVRTRRHAPPTGPKHASLWKPPKLRFPLTPTAPNSTATTQPPTTLQPLEPLDTNHNTGHHHCLGYPPPPDSPSTTPFRFTSFPASLPRVHPPLSWSRGGAAGEGTTTTTTTLDQEDTDSVRKRMFGVPPSHPATNTNITTATTSTLQHNKATPFAASSSTTNHHLPYHHPNNHSHSSSSSHNPNNTSLQSREEEGTQNTSISSLSTQGEEDPRMPPVHTRLFLEDAEYAYSDDDDDDENDNALTTATEEVGRTRLNFNGLMTSPKHKPQTTTKAPLSPSSSLPPNEDSPFKDLGEAAEKDILRMTSAYETDLSRPYEHRQVHSFPSTMSSHSPLRNLSGCDDMATASTAGMTGCPLEERTTKQPSHPNNNHTHHHHQLPATPEEVQLHFQFDETQCSPIPGIPEEEDLRARPPLSLRSGKAGASRLPPKPYQHNPPTESTNLVTSSSSSSTTFKSNSPGNRGGTAKAQDSFSHDSVSSTASAKLRRRPMPDMSAFGADAGSKASHDRSVDDNMSGTIRSPSPKLHCPPTPVRTPAWAHANENPPKEGAEGGPMVFHRSNSLIMTRVLATCTDSAFPVIEAAATSGLNKADGCMDQEMDMGPATTALNNDSSTETEHPEAPPRIRRSVGEMGTISSFATDFESLGLLGKGAFADVYKVRSKLDNNLYAVKRNRRHFRGKRDRDIALAEVRSMQRLQQQATNEQEQHRANQSLRYLLFFYRAWQEDGHFFCQTELCCRDTCREMMDCLSIEWNLARSRYPSLLRNLPAPDGVIAGSPFDVGGRLVPDKTVWKICHDVCAGLSHIHARGLVHNDIKPSNIFFVAQDQLGALCKIGDFGLAGEIGTSDDGQEGDQKFMAPELLDNGVKHASADIFSLGLTLYEISTGFGFALPKQGPRWHELRSGRHIPELPTTRDTTIGQLIQHMISPEPDKRPPAETILKQERVSLAGNACDEFLRDYIHDIDEYDRQQEESRTAMDPANNEKQTPRNASGSTCRARVCSPTLGPFTTASHNLFTPEAQST